MKNMCCNKKTCGCNKTVNYCGSFLACSGIENGDTFDEVVKKLNAVACDDANTEYSFSENEECENGGFIVTDSDGLEVYNICFPEKDDYFFEENEECENGGFVVKNADEEVVFSVCYPCCGEGALMFEENEECENGGFIVKNSNEDIVFSACYPCCGGGMLTFEETEECENGGFVVKNEDQETVFTYCSPPNCGSFYISNHIIDEGEITDNITFNVEGGSGDYTFDFQHTIISAYYNTDISYDEDLGKITVDNIMYNQEAIQIFFLVTVTDNVTGCVAQYPLYLRTSREG